jgi:hypothetical protein
MQLMLPIRADGDLRVWTIPYPARGCLIIETTPPPPFLFVFPAARRRAPLHPARRWKNKKMVQGGIWL